MNKQIIKMAVGILGRENIKQGLQSAIESLTAAKNNIRLNPDETDTVVILEKNKIDGKIYAHIFTVDETPIIPILRRPIKTIDVMEQITGAIESL